MCSREVRSKGSPTPGNSILFGLEAVRREIIQRVVFCDFHRLLSSQRLASVFGAYATINCKLLLVAFGSSLVGLPFGRNRSIWRENTRERRIVGDVEERLHRAMFDDLGHAINDHDHMVWV